MHDIIDGRADRGEGLVHSLPPAADARHLRPSLIAEKHDPRAR